jgi:hypothetical protein
MLNVLKYFCASLLLAILMALTTVIHITQKKGVTDQYIEELMLSGTAPVVASLVVELIIKVYVRLTGRRALSC